jgi:phosphoenolpyruvate carboxykinase (GTP)
VLKWVVERVAGTAAADDTPIGRVPADGALDLSGLDIDPAVVDQLRTVDPEGWRPELPQLEEHYAALGTQVPQALRDQLKALEKRLAG